MSRSRRATWTFALSLVATGSGVLAGLVATPLLLQYLGDERIGAYRVAAEWVGYLALFDFGISGALHVAFARALGAGDRPGVVAAVRAGTRAGLVLAGLSAAAGLGLAAAAPYMLRGMSDELAAELRGGLLVALVGVAWAPLIAFRPLAEAGQRGYVAQAGLIVQCWLTAGLAVGLAAAGAGLPGQFLAVALGTGVVTAVLVWDALRRYPEILSRTAQAVALPVAFSGAMFAFNLLSRVGMHSDAIIVGLTIGPTAVVAFTLTQRLLMIADVQVMALGAAAWAALVELHHQGRADQFNRRLTQLTRWTGVFGFALIVPTAAATRPFVGLWVGGGRYGGDLLVVATAAYVWAHAVAALWNWPLITTGRVRVVLPIYFVGIPLNVAVSVAGSLWLGVAGPALGSAATVATVWLLWLPFLLRRAFGTPLRPLARAVVGPALLAVPFAAGLWLLADAFPVDALDAPVWARWVVLAAGVGAVAAAYLLLAWVLVLPTEDRAELRGRVFRR